MQSHKAQRSQSPTSGAEELHNELFQPMRPTRAAKRKRGGGLAAMVSPLDWVTAKAPKVPARQPKLARRPVLRGEARDAALPMPADIVAGRRRKRPPIPLDSPMAMGQGKR
jgi:hypothetical protein